MDTGEKLQSILQALPCPVSQAPGAGGETYCVFNLGDGKFAGHASNKAGRIKQTAQVHLFSKKDDGTHQALMKQAIALLQAAGVRIFDWGPDLYESDTGTHHIAITVVYAYKTEED